MPSIAPAARAQVVALVGAPYDATLQVDLLDWPLPCGDVGLPTENQFSLLGAQTTVYAATEGFTTAPAHTPADTWFAPLLAEPMNFGIRLFNGVEPTGESGRAGQGRLDLRDPGGLIDSWLNYSWDGRELMLKRGTLGTDPATWTTVAVLTCDGMLHDLAGKSFRLRDLQYRLYQSTFLLYRYAGTGGIEGDAALLGVPKPLAFGRFFNAEPTLIASGTLVYQIHARRMQEITAVRDGGSALTFAADHGSYAALAAASVSGGFYATCLAEGLLRCGTKPTFGLRADGKGDALGGNYVETRAGIARRIATTIGDLPLGDPTNIDTASFTALDTAQPAPVGIFLRDITGSVGEVLDRFMAGCAGWWTMAPTGLMRVGVLTVPATTADYVLAQTPDLAAHPILEEAPPPRLETSIGWRRNWGPQDPATIAGSVSAADRRLYQEPWSFSDPFYGRADNIAAQHLAARRVFVEGYYALQADADTEAERQRTLFSTPRRRWKVKLNVDPFADVLDKTFEITGVNRLGWGISVNLRSIGLDARASAEDTWLILWS